MTSSKKISDAFTRVSKALTAKPSLGWGTRSSTARLVDGLTCEITEGKWKLSADMAEGAGGNASAPTPGVYGRAALASCLAITYKMYAAKMNITVDSIEVEVQADFDDAGLFGVSDVPAGYSEVRYIVRIESSESDDTILHVLDEADKHSPYLDVFTNRQTCVRMVHITSNKSN